MKVLLDYQIQKQGMGLAQNNYHAGYFLALPLIVAGTLWNLYRLRREGTDQGTGIPPIETRQR